MLARTRDRVPLPLVDGVLQVEEGEVVVLEVPSGSRVSQGGVWLPVDPHHGGVVVRTDFEGGATHQLQVVGPECLSSVRVEVLPRAQKLPASAWAALLGDLDAWMPALRVGAEGAGAGSVGWRGASSPLLAQAVLPLVPALMRALTALLAAPRHLRRRRRTLVPLLKARRARAETVRWLGRRPTVAGHVLGQGEGVPPPVPVRRLHDTMDHPANRHIVWMVGRVVRHFRRAAHHLDPLSEATDALTARPAWCRDRARSLREAADGLERRLQKSLLADVSPRAADPAALLVVVDHPRYRQVHQLCRQILTATYATSPEGLAVPTRPSFDLYELWTVLAVRRALDAACPGLLWDPPTGFHKLLDLSKPAARWSATRGATRVTIHFSRTFSFHSGRKEGPWSVSVQRIPDLCVHWTGPSAGWLCLDAKYRVGRRALYDELKQAHIYRDALRWGTLGRPKACLLLVPGQTEDAAHWFAPSFWRAHRVGAAEARPGVEPSADLVAFLKDRLAGA